MSSTTDFIVEKGTLTKYAGSGDDVCIPEGVTRIGMHAFTDPFGPCSVLIPSTLSDINFLYREGRYASIRCAEDHPLFASEDGVLYSKDKTELIAYPTARAGKFQVPETVKAIRKFAFAFSACSEIHIPDCVTDIDWAAFQKSALVSIRLPKELSVLAKDLFSGCQKLKTVTLPEKLTEIEDGAFLGCKALKKLNLPASLKVIRKFAFAGCGVKELDLPNGLEEIDGAAFSGCKNLKELVLPDSTVRLQGFAFADCAGLQRVSMPVNVNNVTIHRSGEKTYGACDMRYGLFSGCPHLEEIELRGVYNPEINYGKETLYEYRDVRAFKGSEHIKRIIAIGTPLPLILKDWQYYAIAGFCKARMSGADIAQDICDSYIKAMKSRKKQLCEKYFDDAAVISCLLNENLLTPALKADLLSRLGDHPEQAELAEQLK